MSQVYCKDCDYWSKEDKTDTTKLFGVCLQTGKDAHKYFTCPLIKIGAKNG